MLTSSNIISSTSPPLRSLGKLPTPSEETTAHHGQWGRYDIKASEFHVPMYPKNTWMDYKGVHERVCHTEPLKYIDKCRYIQRQNACTQLVPMMPRHRNKPTHCNISLHFTLEVDRHTFITSIVSCFSIHTSLYSDILSPLSSPLLLSSLTTHTHTIQAIDNEHVAPLDAKSDNRILLVDELDVLFFW